jgi:hypothetical protein
VGIVLRALSVVWKGGLGYGFGQVWFCDFRNTTDCVFQIKVRL